MSETQVTESAPGQIKAGGNMDLSGAQILNDKSKILAGGLFTITAGNLKSDDTKGIKETIATGIRQLYEVRSGSDYDEKLRLLINRQQRLIYRLARPWVIKNLIKVQFQLQLFPIIKMVLKFNIVKSSKAILMI